MFTTWKLTLAEMKMFLRNRQALFFTFFTPLFIMVIFGIIGFNSVPKIDVGVALQGSADQNTEQFLMQLQSIPVFKLSYGTFSEEQAALEKGDRAAVINLTNNPFTKGVGKGSSTLDIYKNAGDPNSSTVESIISQMIDKASLQAARAPQIVGINAEEVNSNNLKYIDFLLPGLVALSVMQLAVFSVAFVFVEYKEKGILKRVLATPVRPYQFVVANIITRLIISVIQTTMFILVGVLFFGVTIIGSYWLIALIVILGATMFLGLGFIVSGVAKTVDSVPALANLIVFPMIFLGGVFFNVSSMPTWLQYVSKALPLTYFSDALREIMNNGATISEISTDVFVMLGWVIVLVSLAIYTFRFEDSH